MDFYQTGHDACGVGFVASTKACASHQIVRKGLRAIASVQHRGGVGADGKTGDGAGIKTQLPQHFFCTQYNLLKDNLLKDAALPNLTPDSDNPTPLAVGQLFLPRQQDSAKIQSIIMTILQQFGYDGCVWRDTPVNSEVLGAQAKASMPLLKQILIPSQKNEPTAQFEKKLYIARRMIETQLAEENLGDFYVVSLSSHNIIYKGLSLATQLGALYPDLTHEDFTSTYVVFHQRFSTNTTPIWQRAHPFRFVAHNGEINSIQGNINNISRMDALFRMTSEQYAQYAEDILPIIIPNGSDSATIDNVIEALSVVKNYSLAKIKTMLVPPAFLHDARVSDAQRRVYKALATVIGPWDGPATLAMSDATQIVLGGDRNGLRPVRYVIDDINDLMVAGSEEGMVVIDPADISRRGNLEPGQLLGVDIANGGVLYDADLKADAFDETITAWAQRFASFFNKIDSTPAENTDAQIFSNEAIRHQQKMFGISDEMLDFFLLAMARDGKEPLGAMNDDAQSCYLMADDMHRPFSHFFKQQFAQVTNPPLDPIREEHVTSLVSYLGMVQMGDPDNQQPIYELASPVLGNQAFSQMRGLMKDRLTKIDVCFMPEDSMQQRLHQIQQDAIEAAQNNRQILLSDKDIFTDIFTTDATSIPMPILLVTSAVHSALIAHGLRNKTSIHVQSAETIEPHDVATLIGMGADIINSYLAEDSLMALHQQGRLGSITLADALRNYQKSLDAGLVKIMSKMGISDVNSYRGARLFEALGLATELMSEFFPGVPSPISGLNLTHLQQRAMVQQQKRLRDSEAEKGGLVRLRKGQLPHAIDAFKNGILQASVQEQDAQQSYQLYQQFVERVVHDADKNPIYIRDLWDYDTDNVTPIAIEAVEPIDAIMRRLVTGAMSMGSISREAHILLAQAMNRLGGKSNSGEGGEDPQRIWDADSSSAVKQIASGRFGVTTDYLVGAQEIQIKVAQGAKPGEGGQLMGEKVSAEIAALRHCEPGTTLISPPPHHDIYSIEDLAQLIFDLKEVNADANINVKLVASHGVEIIAVGVVKAGADLVHIAGGRGGTGASPQTSIFHAGQEFETALFKTHQTLVKEGLRDRVRLVTDGSLRTGKDVVMAALMGAEEFGFGLQALIAEGCQLARVCHKGTCPVGVATQIEELRANFSGTVESVIRMFENIARDVRENLALIGIASVAQALGRTDVIKQVKGYERGIDCSDILGIKALPYQPPTHIARYEYHYPAFENHSADFISLDRDWWQTHQQQILAGDNFTITHQVSNQHRNIGTRISGQIAKHFKGTADSATQFVTFDLKGIGGQSLGAFMRQGLTIMLEGTSNDYVGKGLSGGEIIIRPEQGTAIEQASCDNIIIGNTCLYGATSGALYAAGQAGNRFAIRLSGALAVVEGVGENACEYMTGGEVVILGRVGNNVGAGMSGGQLFIYDGDAYGDDRLACKISKDIRKHLSNIECGTPTEQRLKMLIEQHIAKTGSLYAQKLMENWQDSLGKFRHISLSQGQKTQKNQQVAA